MISRILIIALLTLQPVHAQSEEHALWEGSLWNLNYEGDISTYGYFRVFAERSVVHGDCSLLRIEWIEQLENHGKRLFASRLISEPELCLASAGLRVTEGEMPSWIQVTNAKGTKLRLHLLQPTQFQIEGASVK